MSEGPFCQIRAHMYSVFLCLLVFVAVKYISRFYFFVEMASRLFLQLIFGVLCSFIFMIQLCKYSFNSVTPYIYHAPISFRTVTLSFTKQMHRVSSSTCKTCYSVANVMP